MRGTDGLPAVPTAGERCEAAEAAGVPGLEPAIHQQHPSRRTELGNSSALTSAAPSAGQAQPLPVRAIAEQMEPERAQGHRTPAHLLDAARPSRPS